MRKHLVPGSDRPTSTELCLQGAGSVSQSPSNKARTPEFGSHNPAWPSIGRGSETASIAGCPMPCTQLAWTALGNPGGSSRHVKAYLETWQMPEHNEKYMIVSAQFQNWWHGAKGG